MSDLKIILRIFVLASSLFALIATPAVLSPAVAREGKAKTVLRGNQVGHRGSARDRQPTSKGSERKLTRQVRANDLKQFAKSRRARILKQHAAAIEKESADTLRNRVQSMIALDETAGEDMEVRRVAVNALGNHAGTVVVMDPNTGRIYSIVNQQWALREGFKPCSTIKLVTGLAGLNEKLIDSSETTNASTAHGMDLTRALAHSNNEYFQQVGGRVGFDKLLFYARQLGLGEKTGINGRKESAGSLPLHKSGFALNRMSSHGDDFQVTAVQLATLVSAMTNGGKLLSPYVPHTPRETANVKPRVRRQIKIDTEVWSHMVPGMIGAVNYGSGRRAYNPRETIAGKTGTCIQQGTWVGLFASYAPLAKPRLAVVVIGLGPDARAHFPAAVAGEIYRNLNYRFGMPDNRQIANSKTPTYKRPHAALADDNVGQAAGNVLNEAKHGTAMNGSRSAVMRKGLGVTRAAKGDRTVKTVLMSIPNRTEGVINSSTNSKSMQQATRPRRVASVQF